jgi:hypothetical protein
LPPRAECVPLYSWGPQFDGNLYAENPNSFSFSNHSDFVKYVLRRRDALRGNVSAAINAGAFSGGLSLRGLQPGRVAEWLRGQIGSHMEASGAGRVVWPVRARRLRLGPDACLPTRSEGMAVPDAGSRSSSVHRAGLLGCAWAVARRACARGRARRACGAPSQATRRAAPWASGLLSAASGEAVVAQALQMLSAAQVSGASGAGSTAAWRRVLRAGRARVRVRRAGQRAAEATPLRWVRGGRCGPQAAELQADGGGGSGGALSRGFGPLLRRARAAARQAAAQALRGATSDAGLRGVLRSGASQGLAARWPGVLNAVALGAGPGGTRAGEPGLGAPLGGGFVAGARQHATALRGVLGLELSALQDASA